MPGPANPSVPAPPLEIDLAALPDGTHRLRLRDGRRVFAKVRHGAPPDFFAAESRGLALLANARSLRVPAVLGVHRHGIALADLGHGEPAPAQWQQAGARLALLHSQRGRQFGLDDAGYCGDNAQDNSADGDGARFFAQRRLLPQMRRAVDAGRLDAGDGARIETLCARLPDLLPANPPVLVHGDLWLGNLHACADGELALIDGGAVHFGWADADLAMLTLFGEPPACFFAAYAAARGMGQAWRAYAPLLNLYHLLNHLNLFGSSYLHTVWQIVRRYA